MGGAHRYWNSRAAAAGSLAITLNPSTVGLIFYDRYHMHPQQEMGWRALSHRLESCYAARVDHRVCTARANRAGASGCEERNINGSNTSSSINRNCPSLITPSTRA